MRVYQVYIKNLPLILLSLLIISCSNSKGSGNKIHHIVFVSDQHYGIDREFNGKTESGDFVNNFLVKRINQLPSETLPQDKGLASGEQIASIEMLINGGDISNRQQVGIQSSASSWSQFENNFLNVLNIKNSIGEPTEVFLIPGNHDVSNAIGYPKPMEPITDPTAMVEIYNHSMSPDKPLTNSTFDYYRDKIRYYKDRFGIRFFFVDIWPGVEQRAWMDKYIVDTIPSVIFTHDEPNIEYKHLSNPESPDKIIPGAKYEHLIKEVPKASKSSDYEQNQFGFWLAENPAIKAYFHGNTNFNQFYTFTAPDSLVSLPTFRVDSPMKGEYSRDDQSLLSFHLISIDSVAKTITVRECFWAREQIEWGDMATFSIQ